MASVKISELNTLVLITSDDFIPIVDSGSGTTYRVTFNTLNDWMATYGSASHAEIADLAHDATSASYAVSASYASSASFATRALTASYYDLTGFNSDTATSASYADTASVLHGRGTSWEQYLQISGTLILSASAYMGVPRKRDVQNESITENSIFFHHEYGEAGSDDWTRIYFSEDVTDAGRMVFEHGDNLDALIPAGPNIDFHGINSPGFLWQTFQNDGPYATGSLMFLKTDGNLYVRAVEARNFTSSLTIGLGFQGTSSYALHAGTASVLIGAVPSTTMPWTMQGLDVKANWAPLYSSAADKTRIAVKARRIVVHNQALNTLEISGVNVTNDRTGTAGAGGLLGAWTAPSWYDLFLIYRSDTQAMSTVLKATGPSTIDSLTFATDIYPDLVTEGQPEWDYGVKVASLYVDVNSTWQQWLTWGSRKLMTFQAAHPLQAGVAYGYNIFHGFGHSPVDTRISVILKVNNTTWNGWGYYKFDEIFSEGFISDYGGSSVEAPPWFCRNSENYTQIGQAVHANGYETLTSNGTRINIASLQADLGLIVRMWAD